MHKILFLEYKFRDFSDEEIMMSNPTGVMCASDKLTPDRITQIKRFNIQFGVSFVVLPGRDSCPLSPDSKKFAFEQLSQAISLKPDVIWFDYLMFPGKWKILDETSDYVIHKDCEFCKGRDRQEVITEFAQELLAIVPVNIKTGIFTMPLMMGEYGKWETILGQNLSQLGNLFDYISPMLYHKMIKKPVEYIHEYVSYLKKLGIKSQIIPILQLKDMPDDLPDELTIEEFGRSVTLATQAPSDGLAIFSWDQAIEKNKLNEAGSILRNIDTKDK